MRPHTSLGGLSPQLRTPQTHLLNPTSGSLLPP
jgi:hypothetical protein